MAAALDSDEVADSELEAVDQALDDMMLGEKMPTTRAGEGKALLSVEEARAKLSTEILNALGEKFKGSLTQTRHLDERDQIF